MKRVLVSSIGLLTAAAIGFAGAKLAAPSITMDTTQLTTLQDYSKKAQKAAEDNYAMVLKTLQTDDPAPDRPIRIICDMKYKGVAATSGRTIRFSPEYVVGHTDDLGMIVHEEVHVIQGYKKYDPVWLVEGIADWVRWFHFEPEAKRPHPRKDRADARASYQTTAAFLVWASGKYDKDLVPKLHKALRDGTYVESMFKDLTGKTLDDLNAEWKATLQ